jgi:hypothetical protein
MLWPDAHNPYSKNLKKLEQEIKIPQTKEHKEEKN